MASRILPLPSWKNTLLSPFGREIAEKEELFWILWGRLVVADADVDELILRVTIMPLRMQKSKLTLNLNYASSAQGLIPIPTPAREPEPLRSPTSRESRQIFCASYGAVMVSQLASSVFCALHLWEVVRTKGNHSIWQPLLRCRLSGGHIAPLVHLLH